MLPFAESRKLYDVVNASKKNGEISETKFNNVFQKSEVSYIYASIEKWQTRHIIDKYGYTNVYRVTTYGHIVFDRNNGQDIIAFEEFRSSFKIEDMFKYLEG